MPDVLTGTAGIAQGLEFMFGGWVVFVPMWVIAKFAMM